MSIILKIVAVFTSILFSLAGVNESVIGYTDGTPIKATRQEYSFDNNRLLIGAYYAEKGKMKEASEAGIDFFITNNVDSEMLDEANEYNIGIIAAGYNLQSAYGTFSDEQKNHWVNFNYASDYKDHPALWGDDLIDEPNSESYENISAAVNAYYANKPGKITLVNLFPNYADNEQLTETPDLSGWSEFMLLANSQSKGNVVRYKKYISNYINTIDTDYISLDFYPYFQKQDGDKIVYYTSENWIRNLDVVAEACRETGRDFWIITQAAGETLSGKDGESCPRYCDNVETISQQAYASLAFGAKAIIHAEFAPRGWWDAATSHMIDSQGNTTKTYDSVKEVDSYLDVFAVEYGKYDYTSTYRINPSRIAGETVGKLAVAKSEEAINLKTSNGIIVGSFTGKNSADGKAYVITNMEELANEVTASVTYTVPAGKTATIYKQGKTAVLNSGEKTTLTLAPGEGVFMTVK